MESTQIVTFDAAEIMLGILATSRAVQNKRNELVHVKENVVLDCLLEELHGIEERTISTFSEAAKRVWDRIKPRIEEVSSDKMIKIFQNARNAVSKMKANGFKLMFSDEYPIRLMLCWTDALELVINAYEAIEKMMISPHYKAFPGNTQDEIYDVAIGAGILFTRVAEQSRTCVQAKASKQYLDGDQIDSFVQLLAKDMAYLLKIQSANHLLAIEGERLPPEKEDFAAFQKFLIKNYGNA